MDERLAAKLKPIERRAYACGWTTGRREFQVEGCDAVQLSGTATSAGRPFVFSMAFYVNPDTGRVNTLRVVDAAAFVMFTPDDDHYWYGPFKSFRAALESPAAWCGFDR